MSKTIFEESCGIVMTKDKKCVVRGRNRQKILCLVDETCRARVYKSGIAKNLESFIDQRFLKISDGVKREYNLDTNLYRDAKDVLGELETVKLKGVYLLIDEDK